MRQELLRFKSRFCLSMLRKLEKRRRWFITRGINAFLLKGFFDSFVSLLSWQSIHLLYPALHLLFLVPPFFLTDSPVSRSFLHVRLGQESWSRSQGFRERNHDNNCFLISSPWFPRVFLSRQFVVMQQFHAETFSVNRHFLLSIS